MILVSRDMAAQLLLWMTREHWLVGAALARVMLGTWAIYYYVLHLPVREMLWGPGGIWPHDRFLGSQPFLSVWQLSGSPAFAQAVYFVGIVVALAFTLGYRSRLAGALHWFMIWSLQERNPLITDGGDNIMRIVLLFLILVNTGAYFSLDARRLRRPLPPTLRQSLAIVHNVGVLLILAQLAMLYMSTGLYKAMGELWQNGTALYYILRVDEFSWPGVAEFVYRNPYLVVLGTYGTVLFEVAFPPALFNRWTRYAMMLIGASFHVSIALFMGLVTFAWSMLSVYPVLVTDEEYRTLQAWYRRRFGLIVFYDGWCALCARSVRWLQAFDLLALVQFVSFREPGIVELYGLDPDKAARRMQSLTYKGWLREGMDSVLAVALRSILLWPLVPLLWLGRLVAGHRLYDALARRRFVVIPIVCDGHCSTESPAAPRPLDRAGGTLE
jgi:predicted DCC family thiol-disulfide oxidoreductase YuxK